MDPKTHACKSARPKTSRNTTFTWLEHARPSTKARHVIGAQTMGCYWDNVTVYPYNGYIRSTNPVVRHVISLTCTLERILVNWRALKHAKTQPLHYSNMRAQAPKRPARWRLAAHAASCRSAAGTVTVPAVSGRVLPHILGKKMHLQWEIKAFYFRSVSIQVG